MAKHESKVAASIAILRNPLDIDPKIISGAAASVTVGAVVTAGAALGIDVPTWVALLIVILVYAVAGYWTKSRIPLPDDSGLTENQAAIVAGANAAGAELAGGGGVIGDVDAPPVADDVEPPATNTLEP